MSEAGSLAKENDSVVSSTAAVDNKRSKIDLTVIIFTATLLVSGTVNTIGFKSQSYFYNFKHGFLQSFLMFIGQFLNLVVFNLRLVISAKTREEHFSEILQEGREFKRNVRVSKLLIGFPSFFDAIGSSLQNLALLLMPASVYQLLCGGSIATSCIISKFMLGRQIYRHHWLGNIFALIGFTLVGFSSLINQDAKDRYSQTGEILGIFMVAASLVIQGIQYNTEELIMIKNAVEPQRMVGMEGFFGLTWTFVWMIVLSFIKCTDNTMCDIGGYLEDPAVGVKEILSQTGLIVWSLIMIISVMFFNMSSMNLTKRVSCIYSAFWNATRTACVWIVSLLFGLENWNWTSSPIQLVGFVFLVTGNLTYNEIIEWKIFGLNKKMSKYLKEGDGVDK
jgi:hypothetical protein